MRWLPTTRKRALPDSPDTGGDNVPGIDLFVQTLWAEGMASAPLPYSTRLQDRVWAANRCMQLNSQQIATMPMRFFGAYEPAWVANPDPSWFPNGIGDAVFAIAWCMYSYGDAFIYITDRYANGYPATWTVLNPQTMSVQVVEGERSYRSAEYPLKHEDVVQITRDPRGGLRGTSALQSYASLVWGMVGATDLGRALVTGGGVPNAVLKSTRKLTATQAKDVQDQWVAARARATVGAPAVLPPELDFQQLAFSAQDLLLLDTQEFTARSIASAFGVPAYMLNLSIEKGLTYQNPQQMFEVWWRTELRPAAGRIQRALSANMLPRGSWVEFDARAILAPTFDALVTSWLQLKKEGVVTVDEVRAAVLHLPPLAEGEALDELTEPPTAAASPETPGDTPEEAIVTELRPSLISTGGSSI